MMNPKTAQQNILIVMADQLFAKALGCYGHNQVISPNIDRLANQGVLFEAAYSSSPLCAPGVMRFTCRTLNFSCCAAACLRKTVVDNGLNNLTTPEWSGQFLSGSM